MFVWYGDTAQSVLKQYHARIGQSFIPPLWALGFQASDASINKLIDLETLADNYLKYEVPLDGVWSDIGYMDGNKDFTLNADFSAVNATLDKWNKAGVHWVPKLLPSLMATPPDGYKYTQMLKDANGAVMSKGSQDAYVGEGVMGTNSIFFDVWSSGGKQVLEGGLNDMFSTVTQFDGLWLDKNEPQDYAEHTTKTDYSNLKYKPGTRDFSDSIIPADSHNTLAEEGNMGYNTYDLHTMYGTKMSQLISDWMDQGTFKSASRRGFLMSRSTFPGFGKFGGHDLGENESTFDFLKWSIAGMLNMNMFGVPLSGAYVCGYSGAATDDLCSRWYQLAAFTPFLHNHNGDATAQHPWSFATNFTLYAARGAARQRYAWMQTLYTMFLDVHSNGGAVAMPTNFLKSYDGQPQMNDYSFMWGDKLLIFPCVYENKATTDKFPAYIPPTETWYNTNDYNFGIIAQTGDVELTASLNYTNVFLKGGSIVAYQNTTNDVFGKTLNSTMNLVQRPVDLIIAQDSMKRASASFALDDGIETGLSTLKEVSLSYENKTLRIQLTAGQSNPSLPWQTASSIVLLGGASQLEATTKVCARFQNLTDSALTFSTNGPNVVIKTADSSPIPYMDLRYVLLVESADDNPCTSSFTVTETTKIGTASEVVNITLAQPSNSLLKAAPINKLTVVAQLYNTSRMDSNNRVVKINITDAEKERFTVPLSTSDSVLTLSGTEDVTNTVSIVQDPFSLSVVDNQDPTSVQLTTAGQTLVFEDRYIEFNMLIASTGQYWGTGDRAPQQFFLKPGLYTSYARDIPTPVETGKPPGNNMYGVHPILYTQLKSGKWMAVFINNANAQDWIL